jgi:hypothetical protein
LDKKAICPISKATKRETLDFTYDPFTCRKLQTYKTGQDFGVVTIIGKGLDIFWHKQHIFIINRGQRFVVVYDSSRVHTYGTYSVDERHMNLCSLLEYATFIVGDSGRFKAQDVTINVEG